MPRLSVHDDVGCHRGVRRGKLEAERARGRPDGAGRARSGSVRSALPHAGSVAGSTGASGRGAGPRGQLRPRPHGRAVRRARPDHPAGESFRTSSVTPEAARHDGDPRHPRSSRRPAGWGIGWCCSTREGSSRPARRSTSWNGRWTTTSATSSWMRRPSRSPRATRLPVPIA